MPSLGTSENVDVQAPVKTVGVHLQLVQPWTAAATPTASATSPRSLLGMIASDLLAIQQGPVQALHGLLGLRVTGHFHEAEAFGSIGDNEKRRHPA